jgi:hypothetical protein
VAICSVISYRQLLSLLCFMIYQFCQRCHSIECFISAASGTIHCRHVQCIVDLRLHDFNVSIWRRWCLSPVLNLVSVNLHVSCPSDVLLHWHVFFWAIHFRPSVVFIYCTYVMYLLSNIGQVFNLYNYNLWFDSNM